MRAYWHETLLAESDATIEVEGNHYFPAQALRREYFTDSDTRSHCGWKGTASYYHIEVDGDRNPDAAWYYPDPFPAAANIRHYVAFWRGVSITP